MEFNNLLILSNQLPIIDSENLYTGIANPSNIEVQLSRWKKTGRLIQLRKGVYLLAEPYRKIPVFELSVAAALRKPSYISLEKALEYHNLIPEAVHVFTSITPKRTEEIDTPLGTFSYQHLKESLFWGYFAVTMDRQTAYVATPEKALLDFFYLRAGDISMDYLEAFRLQNIRGIKFNKLLEFAQRFKKPKMLRIAQVIREYCRANRGEKIL